MGANVILIAENWGIVATSYPDNTLAGYFIPGYNKKFIRL